MEILTAAVFLWCAGFAVLWRVPPCVLRGRKDSSRVSVIIPARNEENNLGTLLSSIPRGDSGAFEVWVVDDASRDGTVEAAKSGGARVIRAPRAPAGWVGKNWACHRGALRAAGECLMFLDADVFFETGGFRKIMETFAAGEGTLSIQPYHRTRCRYEELSAFFNLAVMTGMGAFAAPGLRGLPAGAFGPCLVISRADYDESGGHFAVKGRVLEHFWLGRILQRSGKRLRVFGGRGSLGMRMYPGGGHELAAGWNKSFSRALPNVSPGIRILMICWISGMILSVFGAAASLFPATGFPVIESWSLYGAYALQLHFQLRRIGTFRSSTSIFYPVPLLFFLVLFFFSAFGPRGKASWKGRDLVR
jgi:4,4'-diaponeurosporenoate glycosyltransferase